MSKLEDTVPSIEYHRALLLSEVTGLHVEVAYGLMDTDEGRAELKKAYRRKLDQADQEKRSLDHRTALWAQLNSRKPEGAE